MYLEMVGAACTYLLELDIESYVNDDQERMRCDSLYTLDQAD